MGLLLSILVACVGVVELLAFYSNVTRSFVTTCTWTELTDLNRRYLEEFEKHKKNISVSNYNGVSSSEKIKTEFNESVVKSNSPPPSFRRFLLIGEGAQSSSIVENGKVGNTTENSPKFVVEKQISSREETPQKDFIIAVQNNKPETAITLAEGLPKVVKEQLSNLEEIPQKGLIIVDQGNKREVITTFEGLPTFAVEEEISNGEETSQKSFIITDQKNKTETDKIFAKELPKFVVEEQVFRAEEVTQKDFIVIDRDNKIKVLTTLTNSPKLTVEEEISSEEKIPQKDFMIVDQKNKTEASVALAEDLPKFVIEKQIYTEEETTLNDFKPQALIASADLPKFVAEEKFSIVEESPQKELIIRDQEIKLASLPKFIVEEQIFSVEETPQKDFIIIGQENKIETLTDLPKLAVEEQIANGEEIPKKDFTVTDQKNNIEAVISLAENLTKFVEEQISSAEEILQTDFISTDQKAKPESPITDAEDAEKPRSRSPSPIPKRLGEQEAFRRSPSPYPSLVLPVLRKSICSELLDNPTISVVEVDEELLSRTPTPERIDQILESNNIKTQCSSNQILEVPSRTRFCSVDLKANNQPQVPQPESDFALKDLDRPTQNANENDEDVKEYDEQFLDSLDGVKKKKIGRSGASRRSKKKKITAKSPSVDDGQEDRLPPSSMQNNDAQIAKTLTEAANVLKNVNRRADGPSEKPGTSKDGGSKTAAPFWLIFSGEYTKAMNKDWHGQHFCCWQCDESLTGQRYVLRDEHPYCVSCYESVFANACEKCSRIIGIDSKDLSYKDKHWHEACFLCTTCGESLVDRQFGSKGDRIYCGRCYDEQFASRCDGCHEIFRAGTKKMEYKTRQWHEKCFCCCVCKVPIGTQSFIPREQEIYCAKCYEEKFATRCIKCNKVITSGGVTYKNEPWHRECFTCTHCTKSLAGERFTSRDEKPYCAECFGELFAKRCFACNKPITGIGGTKFISFEDRHWHNDCFFCASCRTSLVGRGFITDQDDIICPECAKQKLM